MAHFQMEQELNLALRLDTSLSIAPQKHGRSIAGSKSGSSGSGSSLSTSQLLAAASSAAGGACGNSSSGRSRSASRLLSPSRLLAAPGSLVGSGGRGSASLNTSVSPSRSRLTIRAAPGGSSGESRSRTPSRGRTGTVGDRFIPNRSTCDMEAAHHSIINNTAPGNGQIDSENNKNGNTNQRYAM